jgi:hypothetical protein
MAPEERKPWAICAVCKKSIAEGEFHYRAGIAWLHLKCYEKVKPTPPKHRCSRLTAAAGPSHAPPPMLPPVRRGP